MKPKEIVTLSYGRGNLSSNDMLRLLELFQAKNIFIEIVNLNRESHFYKGLRNGNVKYTSSSLLNASLNPYADIFISKYPESQLVNILDQIIQSNPESLLFYSTDLSFAQFLQQKKSNDTIVARRVSDCVLEIMFDENVLLISFHSERYHSEHIIPKIENIMASEK